MARRKQQPEDLEVLVVKMPKPLFEAINELAKRRYQNRSDLVRQAVLREIEASDTK